MCWRLAGIEWVADRQQLPSRPSARAARHEQALALRAILRPETNKPRTFQLVEFKLGAFYICVKYKLCYLRCRITVCLCLPPRTSTSTASFLRRYPASQFQESLSECDMFAVSLNILPKIKT